MTDDVRHDAQTWIGAVPKFLVSHLDGPGMMERHQLYEQCVEAGARSFVKLFNLRRI